MITPRNFSVNREAKEIVMERVFDAPRELVWKLWTDPDLIPQWWGPRDHKTLVEKMEVRPGGAWRFIQTDAKGNEFAFSGVFKEIEPPKRIRWTFNFEPIGPGHELTEVVTFEEFEGKTKMTTKSLYNTIEDLEGMVRSGMEKGANETMERFAELLQSYS